MVIDQMAAQLAHRLIWDSLSESGLSSSPRPLAEQVCYHSNSSSEGGDEDDVDASEDENVVLPPFLRLGGSVSVSSRRFVISAPAIVTSHSSVKVVKSPSSRLWPRVRQAVVYTPSGAAQQQQQQRRPLATSFDGNETIVRALQSIPRLRSAWKKALDHREEEEAAAAGEEPVQKRAKALPNQKFSCRQYTEEFIEWLDRTTELIVSQQDRTYGMRLEDNTLQQPLAGAGTDDDDEWLANTPEVLGPNHVVVPGDNRCTGCRRYFKTKTFQRQKDLGFFKCGCDRHRASHCVRCRVLQWALSIPTGTEEEETGHVRVTEGVACLATGCGVKWTPADLFVISVQPPAEQPLAESTHMDECMQ